MIKESREPFTYVCKYCSENKQYTYDSSLYTRLNNVNQIFNVNEGNPYFACRKFESFDKM